MKYRLNTTNYHDFATFAVNKLPARSYFIPVSYTHLRAHET